MAETIAAANESGWKDLATKVDFAELKAEFAAAVDKMVRNQILIGAALSAAMILLCLL